MTPRYCEHTLHRPPSARTLVTASTTQWHCESRLFQAPLSWCRLFLAVCEWRPRCPAPLCTWLPLRDSVRAAHRYVCRCQASFQVVRDDWPKKRALEARARARRRRIHLDQIRHVHYATSYLCYQRAHVHGGVGEGGGCGNAWTADRAFHEKWTAWMA